MLFFSCSNEPPKGDSKEPAPYFPYTNRKTYDFQKKAPAAEQAVLKFWKIFESGDIETDSAKFNSNLTWVLPGETVSGNRAEVLKQIKSKRSDIETAQIHVDEWTSALDSTTGKTQVYVWISLEGTAGGGDRKSSAVHQRWTFSQSGKVESVHEFYSQFFW